MLLVVTGNQKLAYVLKIWLTPDLAYSLPANYRAFSLFSIFFTVTLRCCDILLILNEHNELGLQQEIQVQAASAWT